MTYKEALEYIHSVTWMGSRPGLSRITELCEKMNNPQNSLRFVHVAGTNGKGSFSCMLAEILSAAGYRVGLFTSPFIKDFNERIRVNGENIADEELAEVTEYVRGFAETMEDLPTEFELITAIALEYFRRRACDIVVLEVGMGGRLDSTNIIKTPVLSVITEISLDHTAMLGDTVEAIAAEKAGIIKPGIPVVVGETGGNAEVREVFATKALETRSPICFADEAEPPHRETQLKGFCQEKNTSTILSALEFLKERLVKRLLKKACFKKSVMEIMGTSV